MAGILVFKKLTAEEAIVAMGDIEKWFRNNPRRRVCNSDLFKIRRGYLVEDVLKHSSYVSPSSPKEEVK
jgi:hypothetical protein